jgi:hypothetical protein
MGLSTALLACFDGAHGALTSGALDRLLEKAHLAHRQRHLKAANGQVRFG